MPCVSSLHIGVKSPLVPTSAIRRTQQHGNNVHGFLDFLYGTNEPECYMVPDPRSYIRCPWRMDVGWLSCFLYFRGDPSPYCPRRALVRQIKRAEKMGYRLMVGVEPEFTLMNKHR